MKTLFYYFAFPHYRREILEELNAQSDGASVFASGKEAKANIKVLTSSELNFITDLKTTKLGPFTWQHNILKRALSSEFDSVVLGPATTSIPTLLIVFGRRISGQRTYLWGQNGRVGERGIKRYIQEVLNRSVSGLLVYGNSEAAAAGELGTNAKKIHIVNNATHSNDSFLTEQFSEDAFLRLKQRTREAAESGKMTLTYVGRLNKSKKIDTLLVAARELHEQFPNLIVQIIGGGDAESDLKEQFNEPYFQFLGWIYEQEELYSVIKQSTLMVSPFHQGLMAIDSLRMGVPVLVPDNPHNGSEVEALTEHVNSLRFTPGSSSAISSAVRNWIEIAPTISGEDYKNARISALEVWSPKTVASKILEVVQSDVRDA
ncbi:glycosyltransferase [Corynebacterium gallinarum]|uniref:Glycosyltransferase n=1 Tax=Corynebacterium gallinarum TaxID=2762214 RepID=A0A8I0HQC1_9CORY|nr:glycosyltransferase [Corynebacterium gallinarum]MBD8031026.1 glycosyltransferase [Corynebacterium gallinarum]